MLGFDKGHLPNGAVLSPTLRAPHSTSCPGRLGLRQSRPRMPGVLALYQRLRRSRSPPPPPRRRSPPPPPPPPPPPCPPPPPLKPPRWGRSSASLTRRARTYSDA